MALGRAPWRKAGASLLAREDASSKASTKIAGFDLNDTLVSSKIGAPGYQVTVADWKFYNDKVPQKLRELHEQRFRLVIFTNQGNIRSALDGKRATAFKGYVDAFAKELGLPLLVLAATQKDDFRKPKTGMWQHMAKVNGPVDLSDSFFVGDAAGGPGEHSADDANFAKAVGVRFIHARDFFGEGGEEREDGPPKKVPRLGGIAESLEKDSQLQGPVILVMVGLPGCGKTTFAEQVAGGLRWRRVCQDLLKSKEACLRAASAFLEQGLSVIIDRTNINAEQRSPWVELARDKGVPCHGIVFDVSAEECCRRAVARTEHEGNLRGGGARIVVMKINKMQQAVGADEGFDRLHVIRDDAQIKEELRFYLQAATGKDAGEGKRGSTQDAKAKASAAGESARAGKTGDDGLRRAKPIDLD